jgi:hapalindole-type alkaloid chlorinase
MKVLKHFRNLFNDTPKAAVLDRQPLLFKYVDYADLPTLGSNVLSDIQSRRNIDGIVIRNFLSGEENETLKSSIKEYVQSRKEMGEITYSYPPTFGDLEQNFDREEVKEAYFLRSGDFIENFVGHFKIDFLSRLLYTLQEIQQGTTTTLIPAQRYKSHYLPATIRLIPSPRFDEMRTHCGNMFCGKQFFSKYYEDIVPLVEINDQLSYFMLVQKPEKGGKLMVYNVTCYEAPNTTCQDEIIDLLGKDGQFISLHDGSIEEIPIEMNEGDLLVFAGGELWHRVSRVEGSLVRYSLGGFMGFAHDRSKLYVWS